MANWPLRTQKKLSEAFKPRDITAETLIPIARAEWGQVMAKKILSELITSINIANVTIHPPDPIDVFQIQIEDIPEIENGIPISHVIGLHTKWSGFSLVLDRASPQAVLNELRPVVIHETAHVYTYQHRINTQDYADNIECTPLDNLIEEGMALCAEEDILGVAHAYKPNSDFTSYDLASDKIRAGLMHYKSLNLTRNQSESEAEHIAAVMGDASAPRRGYKLGHAVVHSAIQTHHFTLHEMLSQPRDFYVQHVDWMLSNTL